MYVAMNRFRVVKDQTTAFEKVWRARADAPRRNARIHRLPSAARPPNARITCSMHRTSLWVDEAHFQAWTRSQQFREAHRNAGQKSRPLPRTTGFFEGFYHDQLQKELISRGHDRCARAVHLNREVTGRGGESASSFKASSSVAGSDRAIARILARSCPHAASLDLALEGDESLDHRPRHCAGAGCRSRRDRPRHRLGNWSGRCGSRAPRAGPPPMA